LGRSIRQDKGEGGGECGGESPSRLPIFGGRTAEYIRRLREKPDTPMISEETSLAPWKET